MNTHNNYPPASLLRRLSALLYDGLIILAIEMMAGGLVIAILEALVSAGLISYAPYQDVSDLLGRHPVWSYVYTAFLGAVWIWFLVFFWTRGGQTVGMRAWKLRLQNADGRLITTKQALIRIGTSVFGLANLLVPFHPDKKGFHDLWAKTEVVVLPKV
ncbi:RDD family protein [Vibrio sp. SCSIO 43137]|uniref:RDD family protein n=1 Tax=Vibrio sp. SCSIO 43137 TaxID=3021011 RepID=UPI002307470F|nr:RDD family protein [Vibrio sp. SCSIO 43137]WCE30058.1 RDD family protein [Vibrio sp. SCSIO 43137]